MKIEKVIEKMLSRPKEMDFNDVKRILEHEGWIMRKTTATSHIVFKKEGVEKIITLSLHSSNSKIKATYIRLIVQILELEEKYGKK